MKKEFVAPTMEKISFEMAETVTTDESVNTSLAIGEDVDEW